MVPRSAQARPVLSRDLHDWVQARGRRQAACLCVFLCTGRAAFMCIPVRRCTRADWHTHRLRACMHTHCVCKLNAFFCTCVCVQHLQPYLCPGVCMHVCAHVYKTHVLKCSSARVCMDMGVIAGCAYMTTAAAPCITMHIPFRLNVY